MGERKEPKMAPKSQKPEPPPAPPKRASRGGPRGRPTDFTDEIAEVICRRLEQGESLRTICLDDDMPSRQTVYDWKAAHTSFLDRYTRARTVQLETFADELPDMANGSYRLKGDKPLPDPRLAVDTHKWLLATLAPRFQPKKQVTVLSSDWKEKMKSATPEQLQRIADGEPMESVLRD